MTDTTDAPFGPGAGGNLAFFQGDTDRWGVLSLGVCP